MFKHTSVFIAWPGPAAVKKEAQRIAQDIAETFQVLHTPHSYLDARDTVLEIQRSDFCIVVSGVEPGCVWAKEVCRQHGIQYLVIENGLLPQAGYVHWDHEGISKWSSLCGSLDWVTQEDMEHSQKFIFAHFDAQGLRYQEPKHVVIAGQVPHDTAVYLATDMAIPLDLINFAKQQYPHDQLIYCPHPLMISKEACLVAEGVSVNVEKSTIELCQFAKDVVGATSTVLIEALALGAPVNLLGECAARIHYRKDAQKFLAACVARQHRIGGDPRHILSRMLSQK